MSQNFTNFPARTTTPQLSAVSLVGYSVADNVEFQATLADVISHINPVTIGNNNTITNNDSSVTIATVGVGNVISQMQTGPAGNIAVMGINNTSSNYYTGVAMGVGNTASTDKATALGLNNSSNGYYSVAVGYNNVGGQSGNVAYN